MKKNINWEKVVQVFNSVSTTSVRIYFTLLIIAWTAYDYVIQNDIPDSQWLIFLATLAGVDMIQAAVKTASVSKVRTHEVQAQKETSLKAMDVDLEHKKLTVSPSGSIVEQEITPEEEKKEIG